MLGLVSMTRSSWLETAIETTNRYVRIAVDAVDLGASTLASAAGVPRMRLLAAAAGLAVMDATASLRRLPA